ncbi:MAG: uroporphyrinogen-III C-methyltransferase, partial [Gammaproteobacteria bacterium]
SAQIRTLQEQLEQSPTELAFDDSEIRNAVSAVQSNVDAELNSLRQQLASTRSQLGQLNQQPAADWKLNEAQYLLGLANQKLQLEADIAGAQLLLQQADAALLATDSSSALPVRQAIASHLQNLRSLEPVDREGIFLRIDALATQMEALNLLNTMRESFAGRRSESSQAVEVGASEYGIVNATMEFLSSVFVWRRWEDSPEAMLLPGQDGLVKQAVALMLEQAKLAVLRRDQALYRRSLSQARESLQRYEITTTAAGRAVLDEISVLNTLNIDPALPDLGETLALLSGLVSAEQ